VITRSCGRVFFPVLSCSGGCWGIDSAVIVWLAALTHTYGPGLGIWVARDGREQGFSPFSETRLGGGMVSMVSMAG
jgi:hypothetical protein